jgi:hypothetical protein
MVIVFIIQYFKQIATLVKPKPDISIVFLVAILNRTVIIRVQKSMTNIGFTYPVPKSRFPEFNIHVFYYIKKMKKIPSKSLFPLFSVTSPSILAFILPKPPIFPFLRKNQFQKRLVL